MAGTGRGFLQIGMSFFLMTLSGCSLIGKLVNPRASGGVNLTPPSYYTRYYSTQKARYLGEIYSHNLERLTEQLVQSPIGKLQFSNPIVSISMGFFTHGASQPPDERYLEVMIGMPDILQEDVDFQEKIEQLFSQYGQELLAILASDKDIAASREIAGYGLNFSWRKLIRAPSGPHITVEGAVVYIPKENAYGFVNRRINQQELFRSAALFVRQGEQPARLLRPFPPSPEP